MLSHSQMTAASLELGYLMQADDEGGCLIPVWHLGLTVPSGFEEIYFSAQTGEIIQWKGNRYIVPAAFGWNAVNK